MEDPGVGDLVRAVERCRDGVALRWCEPNGPPVSVQQRAQVSLTLRDSEEGGAQGWVADLSEGGLRATVNGWEGEEETVVRVRLSDPTAFDDDGEPTAVAQHEVAGTVLRALVFAWRRHVRQHGRDDAAPPVLTSTSQIATLGAYPGEMLVLTRRAGESIMIGPDVAVRVIEVRGDVVRLGVDAPREVQVHREEVFNAVRAQDLGADAPRSAQADALRADLVGQPAAARPRPWTAPPADGAPVTPVTPSPADPATASRPVPSPPRPGPPPR